MQIVGGRKPGRCRGELAPRPRSRYSALMIRHSFQQAQNNLAVVLLFQCKVDEAIAVLRRVLTTSVGYSSETVLFNLATLLELRTEAALPLKLELLRGVIDRGGEGVKSTCLKLAV